MNRTILFKAKRIDNGEWVEGSYVHEKDVPTYKENSHGEMVTTETNDVHSIHPHETTRDNKAWCDVDPETICQATGLEDKNGKMIFEGDELIRVESNSTFRVIWKSDGYIARMVYDSWLKKDVADRYKDSSLKLITTLNIEITSNIHDANNHH